MRISITMSGKDFGAYHFDTEKVILERFPVSGDTIFLRFWPREKTMVEMAEIILSVDEATPLSRGLQNLLEGRVECEELSFPNKA